MRLARQGAAAAAMLLSACSSEGGGDFGPYLQIMRQSFSQLGAQTGVTLKQAADIPYASMGWTLNKGGQNLIVLATDSDQGQLWTSAAHVVLLIRDGRIKRTVGLPHNLSLLSARNADSLMSPAKALTGPFSQQRIADFPDLGRYGVVLTCRSQVAAAQPVLILGKKIATMRVDERCQATALDWSFTDSFWVQADTGFVWRTRQHIHPAGDVVETEIFRPPG